MTCVRPPHCRINVACGGLPGKVALTTPFDGRFTRGLYTGVMPQSHRYLSLAFVASDLLLEVDAARRVRFAAGAAACPSSGVAQAYKGLALDDLLRRASSHTGEWRRP